jgi:hypothetical protein
MASRVAAHRARLRERGMKPVQIWVPDTGNPALRKSLQQMCIEIENYEGAEDDRAFISALSQDAE